MASFREAFLGKRFVCCALTIVYSIYNTVRRSIASIYNLGIFALCTSVNMLPRVVYIGYGPTYRTIYITYIYIYIYIYIYDSKRHRYQKTPILYTLPFTTHIYSITLHHCHTVLCLCTHTCTNIYIIFIANIYSTVGRSIADRSGKQITRSSN